MATTMERKRILILGSGGMGRRHLKAFTAAGARVSCYDLDPSRAQAIRADFPGVEAVSDLEAAREVDGAVIVTPTDTHVRYARWCVARGLPFLVEKPISGSEDGVEELIKEAGARGIAAGVAFPRRNSRAVARMQAMVAEGFIGKLMSVNATFSQDFRKYRPDYQRTYYARLATGGGILMDALSHHLDLVTCFAGPARSVACLADRLEFEGVEGEDAAVIALRFVSGALGHVAGNQFQKPNEDRLELIGTEGNLRYERISGRLEWNRGDAPAWQSESVDGNWDLILEEQARRFLEAVSGDRGVLRTGLAEGLHTLRIVLAARESACTGRRIDL